MTIEKCGYECRQYGEKLLRVLHDWIPEDVTRWEGDIIKLHCNSRECEGTEHWHHVRYVPVGCLSVDSGTFLEPDDSGLKRGLKGALIWPNLHEKYGDLLVNLKGL